MEGSPRARPLPQGPLREDATPWEEPHVYSGTPCGQPRNTPETLGPGATGIQRGLQRTPESTARGQEPPHGHVAGPDL